MRLFSRLSAVLALTLAAAVHAQETGKPAPDCVSVLKQVTEGVEALKPIVLSDPQKPGAFKDSECAPYEEMMLDALDGKATPGVDLDQGQIGSQKVVLYRDGPQGSGRFWNITIGLQDGKTRRLGCIQTHTLAWRNLAHYADQLPGWRPLDDPTAGKGRVVIWDSIAVVPAEEVYALFPVAYRLAGNQLVVDKTGTKTLLAQWAKAYSAISKAAQNQDKDLHSAIAGAYGAYAVGRSCQP